ncbi:MULTISPECIES: hypothetical protein [unclassified Helicobacter]|uniref:hypothetical protein n=1 Tax=unclassified Helicobacter TaxID=2593540 RepID=UPI000CF0DB3A|nr:MULTISPECIES: hypothetical protein [unclassified Helicobacter]
MKKIIVFCFPLFLFFQGCNSFFSNNTYALDIVGEKKVQASRKGEIVKDNKVLVVATVTHLNEVSALTYRGREYFFVEFYSEDDIGNFVEYHLNKLKPLWVREITKDEFDEVLKPNNKWSKCYLVAFDSIGGIGAREMILGMDVVGFGIMEFDFGFKTLPMQF